MTDRNIAMQHLSARMKDENVPREKQAKEPNKTTSSFFNNDSNDITGQLNRITRGICPNKWSGKESFSLSVKENGSEIHQRLQDILKESAKVRILNQQLIIQDLALTCDDLKKISSIKKIEITPVSKDECTAIQKHRRNSK